MMILMLLRNTLIDEVVVLYALHLVAIFSCGRNAPDLARVDDVLPESNTWEIETGDREVTYTV